MNDIATVETGAAAPLLDVRDLNVTFDVGRRAAPFRAVDGVTLTVGQRETVGVVGESGSGKSTLGRAVLGLVPVASGSIAFEGRDITHAGGRERRALSEDLQVIFQDPYSSLNPARSIGQTLGETMRVHQRVSADEVDARVRTMLGKVGLQPEYADRFPSQFSGGQRQRIAIARALMAQPKLVICDEAVSALDLSIQAQVLNLLSDLQSEFELSYLFIAHDLAVVRHASHRIVVLYAGRIMEEGPAAVVYDSPAHPYTRALLDSAPVLDPIAQRRRRDERARLRTAARVPAAADPSSACPFAPRCPHAVELCTTVRPPAERTDDGSTVACHRWRDIAKRPTAPTAPAAGATPAEAASSPTHRPAPASPAR